MIIIGMLAGNCFILRENRHSLEAESEKCSRKRFRGDTLLPSGEHFAIVYQALTPKKNVVPVAALYVIILSVCLYRGTPRPVFI